MTSRKETVKELKNRDRLRTLFYREFYRQYVVSLQSFHEKTATARQLIVGDIVVINDSRLASYSQFPIGRIVSLTHSTSDNLIRSAKIKLISEDAKLKNKLIVRDRKNLTLLEIQDNDVQKL